MHRALPPGNETAKECDPMTRGETVQPGELMGMSGDMYIST